MSARHKKALTFYQPKEPKMARKMRRGRKKK